MSRTLVIAANWKMYKTGADAAAYFEEFARHAPAPRAGVELAFFPPFPILESVARVARARSDASAGGQNCHWEKSGAYTGEVSPQMLAKLNVQYVIVGHSERRELFGETDEMVAKKLRAVLGAGMTPIVCAKVSR